MNIFDFRHKLIQDYSSYVTSFIQIKDTRIEQYVQKNFNQGILWPEPLIQLNPAFEPGGWIEELVEQGILHSECSQIFRLHKDKQQGKGQPLPLRKHQAEAVRVAQDGHNYVLTTGTGSGKSLSYIIPIVDRVLRCGTGRGIKAIVVYPMNALANSQAKELEKFLCYGYPKDRQPVTFARYTGQETEQERKEILANPPDILLTNYVMLELILTRPGEKDLIAAAQGLRFLVLDELHTYRGRQGADVAMLVRRVRERLAGEELQCVGTSATLASAGSYQEQQTEVASVASQLFGAPVRPEHIIGETLRRITSNQNLQESGFIRELVERISDPAKVPPKDYQAFITDPLSIWIESTFGVKTEPGSFRLVRAQARSLSGKEGAAQDLHQLTGIPESRCVEVLQAGLLGGYECQPNPETGYPPFAFRLHQFISRGDTVYASLEPEEVRHITLQAQQYVPGDRSRILLPLVFCRECGQEYYCVRKTYNPDTDRWHLESRELNDTQSDITSFAGFFYFSTSNPWSDEPEAMQDRLPDDWLEDHPTKGTRIRRNRLDNLPQSLQLGKDGYIGQQGLTGHYLDAPFRFCLHCGVSYGARQESDFGKLTSLGSEGRSTATTILSLSAILNLKQSQISDIAKKLLSFTDNRQDASLQAGHFNDFVEVGLLRAALYKAVQTAGTTGIRHDEIAQKVFDALNLPLELYANEPGVRFQALAETQKALREVLGYRLYLDLRRGWRITSPNLEQCGLLEIKYLSLEEVSEAEDVWQDSHPALVTAKPATRAKIAKVLLDYMRRELAIKVSYLNNLEQERIQQLSFQRLKAPWAIDENERMEHAAILFPRSSQGRQDYQGYVYLSPRGGFGQYLRRRGTFEDFSERLKLTDTDSIIKDLLKGLAVAGLVEVVVEPAKPEDVPGYQVPASALLWVAGEGTKAFHDPIRVPRQPTSGSRTNAFFVEFYRTIAATAQGLKAQEHTAQVPADEREQREEDFREARLPILYCSPTMELGIDIKDLNTVNLRNIPPTPANYAQRGGRAGRSGQPALVFSYCSIGSSHDQYFFKRPEKMVTGSVTPPRLDLGNEDLVCAHVHAIWLAETGLSLGTSLKDLLDLAGEDPSLRLLDWVQASLEDNQPKANAKIRAKQVLATLATELQLTDWYSDRWLDEVIVRIPGQFDKACDRWRSLYKAALAQFRLQNQVIQDASRPSKDKEQAKRLRREAEAQLQLLTETENLAQSDFYSYRYFASEGFLPGYNFPRLPLSAYIPARRGRKGREEYLSRPRFLAISEFGPRAIVYHEGSKYLINKVILPVATAEETLLTRQVKQCPDCGYLHPITDGNGLDQCERCSALLDLPLRQLFQLQNVTTKRRDRINCDEEERQRLGYDIRTGVRFTERGGQPSYRVATVEQAGKVLAKLTYAQGANLWRINLGWARRKDKHQYGFVLDTERGYWARNEQAADDTDGDPLSGKTARVIPYVEDRRHCLLFEPMDLDFEVMPSLQAALKHAIQVQYQLEDNEIAAEPLPTREKRRLLLFYESAEGGAGVLRRLLDDPQAFAKVAATALEICHFDPQTGADLHRAPKANENCEAACYDCLMNYSNQRDHALLDRQAIGDLLLQFAQTRVVAAPAGQPRSVHLEQLMQQTESELERQWLEYLEVRGYRLPSQAQVSISACQTRLDFLYADDMTAIYIDGSPHLYPDRRQRDLFQVECLEDRGYTVVRFGLETDWDSILQKYPHVFGVPHPMSEPTVVATTQVLITNIDLDLFDDSWHPLVRSLAALDGISIEPGGDVMQEGCVIGNFVAEVMQNGSSLYLVDATSPDCQLIQQTLLAQGYNVLAIQNEQSDVSVAKILAAIQECQ